MDYCIDINVDVGEGLDNESKLMPYVSSCNIACGGHTGNMKTMTKVVKLAAINSLKIGAHPSFPDKSNFGRVVMNMSAADLYTSLKQQIRVLQDILHTENEQLHHIKPHGALYNLAVKDVKTAKVIIEVIKSIAMPVKLYAPYKSVISELARKEEIEVVNEAFLDRNYNTDLSLVSREKDNAILSNVSNIFQHLLLMVKHQKVKTVSGVEVPIKASTFCVHSDTKNAQEILTYLALKLPKNNIKIQ